MGNLAFDFSGGTVVVTSVVLPVDGGLSL